LPGAEFMRPLVIGTRGSALALWQANYVRDALRKAHPHLDVQLRSIRTTGDENVESPGANSPLQGMFTKQIQQALL